MSWLFILAIWTLLGAAWWTIAWWLAATSGAGHRRDGRADPRRITVFKSAPAGLNEAEFARRLECVESFVADLDANSELLIACVDDVARWRAALGQLRSRYPQAELRLVAVHESGRFANHKIAMMRAMAPYASGELWLWSDIDMHAPRGTMRSLREDFAANDGRLVTSPYVIREVAAAPQMLDTLFVNVEFLPGVILLGRLDRVRCGFGSCMLFEAREFQRRVDWNFLGSCLADDFHLGRLLGPARLGSVWLATLPDASRWVAALLHYAKWHKTIRWCQPGPYALQLAVLPVIGCMLCALLNPGEPLCWLGLAAVIALDVAAAFAICRTLGCPIARRQTGAVALWSLSRGLTWMASWLPTPIVWRGRKWWAPRSPARLAAEALPAGSRSDIE